MRIDFITIFPDMFAPLIAEGVIAQGISKRLLDFRAWDLPKFTSDKHRSTDDEAYGGGPGMVMLAEPVLRCVEKLKEEFRISNEESEGQRTPSSFEIRTSKFEPHVIMTSPQGRRFDQETARELATRAWLVILCGRYEGFDER